MKIQEYLKQKKIICDGAFGTRFSDLYGNEAIPEHYNITQPEWIRRIHREYLEAGAVLIRTNTFASNRKSLSCKAEEVKKNIKAAWANALDAAKECGRQPGADCFLAGAIGPISQGIGWTEAERREEYRLICEGLLEAGAEILLFETFHDIRDILPVIREIGEKFETDSAKGEKPFIMVQFCVNQYGYSNAGISARRLAEEAGKYQEIDAIGFNCGVGPGHLRQILHKVSVPEGKYMAALPNAGYPGYIADRRIFSGSGEYFAEKMSEIGALGVSILGGCCGTDPSYISEMCKKIDLSASPVRRMLPKREGEAKVRRKNSGFWHGKETGKKLIAVELSPPPGIDDEKVMEAAFSLKNMTVDVLTFPDSPSGRTRADAMLMAMKVQQETGLCVMPHICCRDRNAIAMRSQFLGGYINGIRNILAVTGDPVPTLMRQDIKSVFNFDSVGLMGILHELNQEEFVEDPIVFGGAMHPARPNLEVEIRRVRKKMEQGAEFFLTQPIFTESEAQRLKQIKEETGARILCGIMPLVSLRNALFIKNEMAGIQVDDTTLSRFRADMSREEGEMAGVGIAKSVMEMTEDFVDGYYFSIPFNRVKLLEHILKG